MSHCKSRGEKRRLEDADPNQEGPRRCSKRQKQTEYKDSRRVGPRRCTKRQKQTECKDSRRDSEELREYTKPSWNPYHTRYSPRIMRLPVNPPRSSPVYWGEDYVDWLDWKSSSESDRKWDRKEEERPEWYSDSTVRDYRSRFTRSFIEEESEGPHWDNPYCPYRNLDTFNRNWPRPIQSVCCFPDHPPVTQLPPPLASYGVPRLFV